MTFSWTPHRFSGGALALDVANSVILRSEPQHSLDRFAVAGQLRDFAAAASEFSAERALFGDLTPVPPAGTDRFIGLREAIDRYFRAAVLGSDTNMLLAELLDALACVLREHPDDSQLATATAHSAMRLLGQVDTDRQRLKICPNCGWLFFDRSKNRSRAWCDMTVCGNRVKAQRHYRRKTQESAP